ncbi:hypothetical protein PHLCEN_2v8336 [Hermanssonia centrifuga]|uniref:Uncharacterized protein n=1 Tax=Hermanssonia centrifuga TaxID=98765 RepID=A0A2R6NUI1_9APHY|nr:hypothetical protein PHLCEN_2v8336 [Hermanssonia centrifuga]
MKSSLSFKYCSADNSRLVDFPASEALWIQATGSSSFRTVKDFALSQPCGPSALDVRQFRSADPAWKFDTQYWFQLWMHGLFKGA